MAAIPVDDVMQNLCSLSAGRPVVELASNDFSVFLVEKATNSVDVFSRPSIQERWPVISLVIRINHCLIHFSRAESCVLSGSSKVGAKPPLDL